MTISERLIEESRDIWDSYYTHPFVSGMADGSLPQDKFRYYMLQDYLYLVDYARVFALGAAKAADPDVMAIFAGYVHQILHVDMEIHRGYMQRLGITAQQTREMQTALTTRSYTAFMLRTAYEEGPVEIMAAILSCAVSYEYIAHKMLESHPDCDRHPFYGEWVQGYAAAEYSAENRKLMQLTDQLADGYSEAQLAHLSEIFRICSEYELQFWDMGWNAPVPAAAGETGTC